MDGMRPVTASTRPPRDSRRANSSVRSGVMMLDGIGRGVTATEAEALTEAEMAMDEELEELAELEELQELEELEAVGHWKIVTAGKICVTVTV